MDWTTGAATLSVLLPTTYSTVTEQLQYSYSTAKTRHCTNPALAPHARTHARTQARRSAEPNHAMWSPKCHATSRHATPRQATPGQGTDKQHGPNRGRGAILFVSRIRHGEADPGRRGEPALRADPPTTACGTGTCPSTVTCTGVMRRLIHRVVTGPCGERRLSLLCSALQYGKACSTELVSGRRPEFWGNSCRRGYCAALDWTVLDCAGLD